MTDPYRNIVGQAHAVASLASSAATPVHAYLVVGPPGSGKRHLALAFAADLLARVAPVGAADETVERVLARQHPDVTVIDGEGRAVRRAEAEALRDAAVRSPVEGARKVLIGVGFDAIEPAAAALLLKTVEEPPPSAVIVLLAEDVPPELVTIASRCVQVTTVPYSTAEMVEELRRSNPDADPVRCEEAATAASGNLTRARDLLGDERFALRRDAWLAVPDRLDGTGAVAWELVENLMASIDQAAEPMTVRHAAEREALADELERYGGRRTALRELDEAHKRQLRRLRTDELRFGLGLLARRYADAAATAADPVPALGAVEAVGALNAALVRNPNERLQLQALLARLPPLR